VFVQDYSLIGGLTGVGRYLLFFREDKEISSLLNKVLDYLIKLSEEKTINDQFVPRWYIPNINILFKRRLQNE
jgi:lantibiotic biosynthesis protein